MGITRCYLLLKGAGHQPPQLGQAVVDAIAAALLDDLGAESGGSGAAGAGGAGLGEPGAGRRALTPRRLFLARICEVVEGDMEPAAELRFLRGAAGHRSPRAPPPRGGRGGSGLREGRGRGAWAPTQPALTHSRPRSPSPPRRPRPAPRCPTSCTRGAPASWRRRQRGAGVPRGGGGRRAGGGRPARAPRLVRHPSLPWRSHASPLSRRGRADRVDRAERRAGSTQAGQHASRAEHARCRPPRSTATRGPRRPHWPPGGRTQPIAGRPAAGPRPLGAERGGRGRGAWENGAVARGSARLSGGRRVRAPAGGVGMAGGAARRGEPGGAGRGGEPGGAKQRAGQRRDPAGLSSRRGPR